MVSPPGRRTGPGWAAAALCLLAMLAAGGSAGAQAPGRDPCPPGNTTHRSPIVVPAPTRFALTRKISIGVDKSMLIELPVDLRNLIVSNPEILDAMGNKNIPILGAVFRSNDYQRKESELVILVTPYLTRHAAKADFARPDKGFAPSRNLQELVLGHTNRIYGVPGHLPRARYDYGLDRCFIVEYPDAVVKG